MVLSHPSPTSGVLSCQSRSRFQRMMYMTKCKPGLFLILFRKSKTIGGNLAQAVCQSHSRNHKKLHPVKYKTYSLLSVLLPTQRLKAKTRASCHHQYRWHSLAHNQSKMSLGKLQAFAGMAKQAIHLKVLLSLTEFLFSSLWEWIGTSRWRSAYWLPRCVSRNFCLTLADSRSDDGVSNYIFTTFSG